MKRASRKLKNRSELAQLRNIIGILPSSRLSSGISSASVHSVHPSSGNKSSGQSSVESNKSGKGGKTGNSGKGGNSGKNEGENKKNENRIVFSSSSIGGIESSKDKLSSSIDNSNANLLSENSKRFNAKLMKNIDECLTEDKSIRSFRINSNLTYNNYDNNNLSSNNSNNNLSEQSCHNMIIVGNNSSQRSPTSKSMIVNSLLKLSSKVGIEQSEADTKEDDDKKENYKDSFV